MIQLSSVVGRQPMPYASVYAGTKAFDNNFSLSFAPEVKDKIDVLVVNPGLVET
jgi:short-subunit dehydrogenase